MDTSKIGCIFVISPLFFAVDVVLFNQGEVEVISGVEYERGRRVYFFLGDWGVVNDEVPHGEVWKSFMDFFRRHLKSEFLVRIDKNAFP